MTGRPWDYFNKAYICIKPLSTFKKCKAQETIGNAKIHRNLPRFASVLESYTGFASCLRMLIFFFVVLFLC